MTRSSSRADGRCPGEARKVNRLARPRYQSLGGKYRSQKTDPLTGERLSLGGQTLAELESRQARVRHVRDGLRFGDISPVEARGLLRPAVGLKLPVDKLVRRYIDGAPGPSHDIYDATWRNLLAPWFEGRSLWDCSGSFMREWHSALCRARRPGGKRGYSPKYIRAAWDLLTASVKRAVDDGMVSHLPWGDFSVPSPKRPEKERDSVRDPGELLRLVTAAKAWDDELGQGDRFSVLVFLSLTGLRQAEAAGLSWDAVDFDRNVLHVRVQARRGWQKENARRPTQLPKGGIKRKQDMHPNVSAVLRYQRSRLKERGMYAPDGPVFPNPKTGWFRTKGGVMSPEAFRRVVERAGLPDPASWTVHSTRHGFSRLELIGHGGDLRTVAERTGHMDLEVLHRTYLSRPARGGTGSKIPELPPGLAPSGALLAAPEPILLESGEVRRPALPPAALEERMAESGEIPASWFELAKDWLKNGRRPKPRPAEISARVKESYARAYNAELRATGGNKEAARMAGHRSRRGALGAWARVVTRAEKD